MQQLTYGWTPFLAMPGQPSWTHDMNCVHRACSSRTSSSLLHSPKSGGYGFSRGLPCSSCAAQCCIAAGSDGMSLHAMMQWKHSHMVVGTDHVGRGK